MYNIILCSNSPRRKELLAGLDLKFTTKVINDIDESYPADLPADCVPEYLSRKKAEAYKAVISGNDLAITADTVVILGSRVLGKPCDEAEAKAMLHLLSGRKHHVVTGVSLTTVARQRHFSVSTEVTFKSLTDEEIDYYVSRYKPLDKAGAYGIQEWIGYVGISSINGSYYNVMGLPVQRIYEELHRF